MTKYLAISVLACLAFISCDSNAYFEKNLPIKDQAWNYKDKPAFEVKIDDKNAKYDVFINLRHTNNYDYSNIFVLLHEKGKGLKDTTYRKEIPLAAVDGKWYGNTAGSLYEVQFLAKENFIFPDTGTYTFALEQNMRDNPLKDVNDVGIKIIKK